MSAKIFSDKLNATTAVIGFVMGAFKFRCRHNSGGWLEVLDESGQKIGSALKYRDIPGYALHTANFSGTVQETEMEFV